MYLNAHNRQRGLGLVSAIFVITLLAMMVAGMAQFMRLGQSATIQEVLAQRAYWAAQSGVELAAVCLTELGDSNSACDATSSSASPDRWPTSGTFSDDGLRGCYAEVTRERRSNSLQGDHWVITSTGYCGQAGAGIGSASRQILVGLSVN